MTALATPLALQLFTDRDEPRRLLQDYFDRVKAGRNGDGAPPILSFYGVGGIGKTTLLAKAMADFAAAEQADLHELAEARLRLVAVNYDGGAATLDLGVDRCLVKVRNQLQAAEVATPHFDVTYSLWAQQEFPESARLADHLSQSARRADDQLGLWDAFSRIAGYLGETLPGATAVRDLGKWTGRLLERLTRSDSRLPRRFPDGLPQGWTQAQRRERLPAMLALDLLAALDQQPQLRLCLVVDGFECIQSRSTNQDAQWALQSLLAELLTDPGGPAAASTTAPKADPGAPPLHRRLGFVLLGREKLRWAELYARDTLRLRWADRIDHHCLEGLTGADARAFIQDKVIPHARETGETALAEALQQHLDPLLAAACERRPERPASYLPYYLDLAVGLVRLEIAQGRLPVDPAEFGTTPQALQVRFLRSLPPGYRAAFRALALALRFDQETFAFLLLPEQGAIGGCTRSDFPSLVGDDWSFVGPVAPGSPVYCFHRHMQAALLADQGDRAEDRAVAGQRLLALHQRDLERVRFATPADCGPAHLAAYDLAADRLREVAAYAPFPGGPTLLPPSALADAALKLDACFDPRHHPARRQPLLAWLRTFARARPAGELGEEHPTALAAMGNLANTLWAQGDLPGARALEESTLATRRRVLGDEHPDTTVSAWNLLLTLNNAGDTTAAEAVFQAHLAWLPERDPARLSADQRTIRGRLHHWLGLDPGPGEAADAP